VVVQAAVAADILIMVVRAQSDKVMTVVILKMVVCVVAVEAVELGQ
jgi:hypothetical protein